MPDVQDAPFLKHARLCEHPPEHRTGLIVHNSPHVLCLLCGLHDQAVKKKRSGLRKDGY